MTASFNLGNVKVDLKSRVYTSLDHRTSDTITRKIEQQRNQLYFLNRWADESV